MALEGKVFESRVQRVIMLDLIILAAVYFIPTLSHAFFIPLYLFEPMRIALFVSILFLKERNNSYFLALTLPLFSFFVAGHPVVVKNVIMAIELFANVFILYHLMDKNVNYFASCFISITASKMLYYGLKYIVISQGLLMTNFVDTSIIVQLAITCILSLVFWSVFNKRYNCING